MVTYCPSVTYVRVPVVAAVIPVRVPVKVPVVAPPPIATPLTNKPVAFNVPNPLSPPVAPTANRPPAADKVNRVLLLVNNCSVAEESVPRARPSVLCEERLQAPANTFWKPAISDAAAPAELKLRTFAPLVAPLTVRDPPLRVALPPDAIVSLSLDPS